MRYAIVMLQDIEQYSVGDIARVYEAEENQEGKGIHPSYLNGGDQGLGNAASKHVEIPEGFDERALGAVINENPHPEYWDLTADPTEENRVFEEPAAEVLADYTYVPEVLPIAIIEDPTKMAAAQAQDLQKLVTQKYIEMDTEVRSKMAEVFGTNVAESANAYFETWRLMSDRPDKFVGSNLKSDMEVLAENDSVLFAKGAELDTIQKIQDYANRRIEIAEEYGVWRMERIQAFRNERDDILNG